MEKRSILLSPEFTFVGALCLAGIVLVLFVLHLGAGPGWMLLDLRNWQLTSSLAQPGGTYAPYQAQAFFDRNQPPLAEQQPFRLTLAFGRVPEPQSFVRVEKEFTVDQAETYCFQVWLTSPYAEPDSALAVKSVSVRVSANRVRSERIAIVKYTDPVLASLDGILPRDDKITIQFELRAHLPQVLDFWRRTAMVHFEFADLWPCDTQPLEGQTGRMGRAWPLFAQP